MKELHMICNAHLDPVWLWQKPEGIAEAISTFRVAADFCEEFDGFIFNHNESVLYEWVEENEPELFERIQKLVKEGKWHIMGGWYLQPDCVMPCGESFIRQIETGISYFKEKFGVRPLTAINFDPFGHTRGLVQILKKCGYESYVFMRPSWVEAEHDFIWEGFDGSRILAHKMNCGYNSGKGKILSKIQRILEREYGDGINMMFWGIGDHGGGPSREDLIAIAEYMKSHPEDGLRHSFCENYFDRIDKSSLAKFDQSLNYTMVGCYTSMARIKQAHRKLENDLDVCERILAVSGTEYDKTELEKAEKALLFCEFHDILPGSSIKAAEDDCLRLFNYGSEIVDKYKTKAFFRLCQGQSKAKEGEIPVLVFNPHPYKITREIEVEFQLQDQNWNENEVTMVTVRDSKGNYLPSQNEKEACTFSLDWRKRVCFRAELEPMSINRFDCELHVENYPKRKIEACSQDDKHFIFDNGIMQVLISKKTGLIDKYNVDGIDMLKKGSAKICAYKDNEDPWGMTVEGFNDYAGEFTLLSDDDANKFNGYPEETLSNVRVIENGSVRLKIQAIFGYSRSFAVVTYTLPKNGKHIDMNIKMQSNDSSRFYKLTFDTTTEAPEFRGQTAFGSEKLRTGGKEAVYQKWCGVFENSYGLAVLNKGTYGGSVDAGKLNISLLRTPVYSAHPIGDRPLADSDRNHDRIDIGLREFEYRLTADTECLDMQAEIFNKPCIALSFFPSGSGEIKDTEILIDNPCFILSRLCKKDNGTVLRLFNSSDKPGTTALFIGGNRFEIEAGAFEVKTFSYSNGTLAETNMI
ncbi:MAG: glycoside hydrolase family 38 C-terminal domain-containing protein [Acutalibacteraceae bacterium]|nr:glycoside hydrolase family 38 C-terminal domain-containing protein [Acutalibacteraceae bacterium]